MADNILYRAQAPLRIALAGGGTDLVEYSSVFEGAVLNATINMYAYATLEVLDNGKIELYSIDKKECFQYDCVEELPIDDELPLLKGCYNKIVKNFTKQKLSFRLSTYVEAPPGSGLGSSSTLVVAILSAFAEWLNLPLGEYDLASLAYEVERVDLKMAGGKQDQYAAAFGGVNFIEFKKDGSVLVNPLRIKQDYLNELQKNIVLFYTSVSRYSSEIINQQVANIEGGKEHRLDSMHMLKSLAGDLKASLLRGELPSIGESIHQSWIFKKNTAAKISSSLIDDIYEQALKAGALGGKISGAGGGGFAFFFCPGNARYDVMEALQVFDGEVRNFKFEPRGATSWRAYV